MALLGGLVLLTDFKDALDGIAMAKVNWHRAASKPTGPAPNTATVFPGLTLASSVAW